MWNKCLDWSRIWECSWLSLRHIYNKFAIGIQSETVMLISYMLYDAVLELYAVWCRSDVVWCRSDAVCWSAEQFVNFNSEQHSETVVFHRIILVNLLLNLHTLILTFKRSFAPSFVGSFVRWFVRLLVSNDWNSYCIVLYSSYTSMSDV